MTEEEAMFKYSVLTKSRYFRDVMSTMLWSSDSCTEDLQGQNFNQKTNFNCLEWPSKFSQRDREPLGNSQGCKVAFFIKKRVRLIFSLKLPSNSEV